MLNWKSLFAKLFKSKKTKAKEKIEVKCSGDYYFDREAGTYEFRNEKHH